MAFLGVYRAIYDYAPQSEGELTLSEGDLLFVLDNNSDDDWWKAKKKAMSDEEEEPEGLIPNNYIEEAHPLYHAKALYDYTKQTDEELSFPEDASLDVYDTSDADWTLVGLNGQYGFAPAIYIEKASAASASASAAAPVALAMPARPLPVAEPEPAEAEWNESPPESPRPNPAAHIAELITQRTGQSQHQSVDRGLASPPLPSRPQQYTPEESDEEPVPSMPPRPISAISREPVRSPVYSPVESHGVNTSLPYNRAMAVDDEEAALQSPGGFRLYNISEVVSHMGKNKKMPITLGINLAKGLVSLSPAKARDGPSQEWTADRMTNYSIEGKHVFLDLVRPSKSVDLHAGAKDTAQEIVSVLGELAGAMKAEGLREVWAASSGTGAGGKKKGTMLYDFMAQGDDEVTVATGDEVVILDDTKSEEWWMVKRLKNGKEGVVPSSYVEITGHLPEPSSAYTGINSARSTVEQNRLEEERLTRDIARHSTAREPDGGSRPERHSSLAKDEHRKSKHGKGDKSDKPKPNAARVRTWTDRSGSFKVEAEFIGLKDGKIHLHKQNGVKIAVPVTKMAVEDLEYVENATGISLDEDKPLSEIKRRGTDKRKERPSRSAQGVAGASVEPTSDYDWFDFFLGSGINPQLCERYAAAFSRDQMGEEVLPEVDAQLLRTLGLKEGDILRVMKYLDNKFGRTQQKKGVSFAEDDADGAANGDGGLFSGPGGALRNNTRKGRPAPAVQTNDVVDPDAFKQKTGDTGKAETPLAIAPARSASAAASSGFDDDAWDVKPSKTVAETPAPAPAPAKAPSPPPAPPAPEPLKLTQNMSDLSLLSPALQPTPAPQPAPQAAAAPPQQPARTGADPSFFDKLAAPSPLASQVTGMRQRPVAPTQMQTGNSLIAPPPRAASAPGLPQQGFAPPALQPQLTGYQAPPGQSLQSLQQQQQFQQQQQQMGPFPQQPGFQGLMPQATGYMQSPQQSGFPAQYQMPQATGYGQQQQQPYLNGQATGSPFADPPRTPFQAQPTGLNQSYQMNPQPTGYNGMPPPMQPQQTGLPPALQPQRTGFQPQSQFGQSYQQQQNGYGQFGNGAAPPMPPMPNQPTGLQPLMPQQTGPAPSIRFGVQPANKLTPQPTGRANLAKATPQNPFGF